MADSKMEEEQTFDLLASTQLPILLIDHENF